MSKGWTLTELLVSLALMAVLAAVAVPSYQNQQRLSRRTDAQTALQQLQLEQARWRSAQAHYASDLVSLGWTSDLSASGHYRVSIDAATAEGYTLTASAVGAQARDTACNPMRLQMRHTASVVLSSGPDLTADPGQCWRQ